MAEDSVVPDVGGNVVRIGAPLVEPLPPAPGSVAEAFLGWAERRRDFLQAVERRLVVRFGLDLAYCSINFDHPEYGPSGRVVDLVLSDETDVRFPHEERHRRRAQVMTVPHSGMGDIPARWERGETVMMEMREMGEELGRRFEATAVKWSLSAPLISHGEWFGLLGVAGLSERRPSDMVVAATEAGAATVTASFADDLGEAEAGQRRGS